MISVALLSILRACQAKGSSAADTAYAVLLTGALLASPLGWVHYLWWIIGPAAALLQKAGAPSRFRWREMLVALAVLGLLFPPPALGLGAASGWGRATFGSAYALGVLALWAVLAAGSPYRGKPDGMPNE